MVAGLGDVEAEDVPVGHLTVFNGLGHAVAADQIGHDHRHGHSGAEKLVAAEALRRGKADKDGQEGKRRRGKQVHQAGKTFPRGEHLDDGLVTEKALGRQDVVERHEQTAAKQDGDERHEDIRQHLDRTAKPIAGFGSDVFQTVGGYGHILGNEAGHFLEDDIDVAGTDDDLEHTAGLKGALEIGVIIQRGGIHLV